MKTETINIRLSGAEKKTVERRAKEERRSITQYILALVERDAKGKK